jgi:hypothetical protein
MGKASRFLSIMLLGIFLIVLVVSSGCTTNFKSNIYPSDTNSKPPCANASQVAGFVYSFKVKQADLNVLAYSLPNYTTGNGFYFGYRVFGTSQEAQDYFNGVVKEARDFDAEYPGHSQTVECTISSKSGICGLYDGKISDFIWVDGSTYKVTNKFNFPITDKPSKELEEIVAFFGNCQPQ